MPGSLQHHRLQRGVLVGQLGFEFRRAGARRLGLGPERRPFLGRGVLEAGADGVALGAEIVDLGLERARLGFERQQRVEVEVDPFVADRALDRRRGWP